MSRAARLLSEQIRANLQVDQSPDLNRIFEEEPVPLSVFVTDRRFLGNPPLSPVQYDFVRHFEQVLYPATYSSMVEEFGEYWKPVRMVNFLTAEWGKGSGKDHSCRIAFARVAYILCCLRSPQTYFGMPEQDEIQTLNVARSAPQAHRAFFKPLRTLMVNSPWFKGKFMGYEPPGEQAASIRLSKQIELLSGHSQAETQEGLNLIAAIADEISAFKTAAELMRFHKGDREPPGSAESILKVLRTSARTRFPETFKIAQISYPRFKGDAIEQAVARGREDNIRRGEKSTHYVSGPLATWEVNPRISGKDVFQDDYDEDPDMATSMYECLPQLSPNRYFRNKESVYASLSDLRPDPLTIEHYWGVDPTGEGIPSWQAKFYLSEDLWPVRGAEYTLHGDMALSGDRAGVAMCHVRRWESNAWGGVGPSRDMRPIVKVDFVTAFEADLTAMSSLGEPAAMEVQLRWYRQLVQLLTSRGFNIRLVTFDGWQSVDSIQILNSWGIESKKVSTDTSTMPWVTLRDVMYDGRLEAYDHPILRDELLALTLLKSGKVDHPNGGSKDMADALACSVMTAVALGGDEGEDPVRADVEMPNLFAIGPAKGRGSFSFGTAIGMERPEGGLHF